MIGRVFGNWTVIAELPKNKFGKPQFLCRCSCEAKTEKEVAWANLRNGASTSCGCLRRKMSKQYKTNDGVVVDGRTPFYRAWSNMKQCCDSPKYASYKGYGGAGIKYDLSWKSFETFCEDMLSTYTTGDTLQRKDRSKDFSKANCFWANANNRITARVIDLKGHRFGRLLVLDVVGTDIEHKAIWACQCDCGNKTEVVSGSLLNGSTTSCGCYHLEVVTKHGYTTHEGCHPMYASWKDMKTRCDNENCKSYGNYGGRGIKYTPRWEDFENFLADMCTGYSDGLTIDRINPDLGYFKENCRWATKTEQTRNKRCTRTVMWKGEERVLVEVCKELNLNYHTVLHRLNTGNWTEEKALTTPTAKPYISRSLHEEDQ
jgi:hypothetical protein